MRNKPVVMGIDGGGSTVRAVIVDASLARLGESQGPTANPSIVGRQGAGETIQATMRAALAAANLRPERIAAVGIGIAGAATAHFHGWLRAVVAGVTPQARFALSTDYEIALAGALGERRGVLVLAGTGSLAYGVNAAGESALVGGWGYLLGDEGSGYWLGLQGLRAVTQAADAGSPDKPLARRILEALGLPTARDLIPWVYQATGPRTRAIAELAPLVLAAAAGGNPAAMEIVEQGAAKLAQAARAVMHRLAMRTPRFAFTGGLLQAKNPLSAALCAALDLTTPPIPRHPPVIGAALLALEALG